MARIARCVVVSGRVTGVGFRYATLCEAQHYRSLRGFVRNVDRTTVECLLQGDQEDVEAMVAWLRRGPPGAHVQRHVVSDVPVQDSLGRFSVTL